MDLSTLVKTGVITRPQRGLIFGPKGVGKSNSVVSLENALTIDTEASTHQYPCARINVGNYQQLDTAVTALLTEPNDYRLIAVDTIDQADEYIRAEVCREKGVSDIAEFAHGQGYIRWRDKFTDFLQRLNGFIRLGKHVILVGHSQIRTVSLPGLDPYDRFELKLDKRNIETVTEWADFQLFLNWDIRTIKTKDGTIRARGGNDRFIYSLYDLSYDAKNRLGITEPLKLEPASLRRFLGNFPVPVPVASSSTPSPAVPTAASSNPPRESTETAGSSSSISVDGSNEPVPELSPQQRLKEALYGLHEDWIVNFLIDRQKITRGQSVLNASSEYCERALSRLGEFRDSIIKYGKEHDSIDGVDSVGVSVQINA
jgi:hypothetical protein